MIVFKQCLPHVSSSRTRYHFKPLGVLLNPGIKKPPGRCDKADSQPDELRASTCLKHHCVHTELSRVQNILCVRLCLFTPCSGKLVKCTVTMLYVLLTGSSFVTNSCPPPQCCAQSSGQVTICARGWRISSYSHGNTRPRPSCYLPADLVGRRQEIGAEV